MEIERELAAHHSATLRAIETGRVKLAERRLKAYVKFANAFLDAAAKRGVTFSAEAAQSVEMLDWPTATQIIDHAYDDVLAAVRSGNSELIATAAIIPIDFMKMSAGRGDFLFYRRLAQLYPAILAVSYTLDASSVRRLVADRSWRYLREFADYFLPKLVEAHEQQTREQYVSLLLWAFGDLLKVSMDHSDPDAFGTIGREMNSLFDHLEISGLSPELAQPLRSYIAKERGLIWFGLGAWITRGHALADAPREPGQPDLKVIDRGHTPDFFNIVQANFPNIKHMASVYQEAYLRGFGVSAWARWIMSTLTERQVHSIDFGRWLTLFYVVLGLRLSKSGALSAADIPDPYRDLQFRLSEIREQVNKIRSEQHVWGKLVHWLAAQPVSGSVDESYWNYFLFANQAAVDEWRRRRDDEIISSPIDDGRLGVFRERCLKGWQEGSWLAQVFSKLGHRVDETAKPGATYFGMSFLMPKEAFIADQDAIYVGFGRDLGASLGRDASKNLLSSLENAETDEVPIERNGLVDHISETVRSMSDHDSRVAVFVIGGLDLEQHFLTGPGFSPRWRQKQPRFNFHEYMGDLDNVPVFFVFNEKVAKILLVDMQRVGKLRSYVPAENNFNGLLIRITAIEPAEANSRIDRQPEILKISDGSTRSRESALRDLLLKVRVFVGVKVELEIGRSDAIRKFTVS